MELTSVDKAFQNVLLDAKIVVENAREPVSELWDAFDGFVHAVVSDIIAGGLDVQTQVIADILLAKAIAIMAADDLIGQADISMITPKQ
jgi:hypothetical protein